MNFFGQNNKKQRFLANRLRFVALGIVAAGLVSVLAASCLEPTQYTLEIRTNVKWQNGNQYAVSTGLKSSLEGEDFFLISSDPYEFIPDPNARTSTLSLGTVVITPKDTKDRNASFSLRAVMARNGVKLEDCRDSADSCKRNCPVVNGFPDTACSDKCDSEFDNVKQNCIIDRRRLSFVPHSREKISVKFIEDCFGKPCDPSTTCTFGGGCIQIEGCGNGTPCEDAATTTVSCEAGYSACASGCCENTPPTVKGIVLGNSHSCALKADQSVWCWGNNEYGGLGLGDTSNRLTPEKVANLPLSAVISAGGFHTCAASSSGKGASCWGYNTNASLGVGDSTQRNQPTPVFNFTDRSIKKLALGVNHSCAIATDSADGGASQGGQVWCWGDNAKGEVSSTETSGAKVSSPKLLTFPQGESFVDIALGLEHSCAVTTTGKVYCWGSNQIGQLAQPSTLSFSLGQGPQLVSGLGIRTNTSTAVSVFAGSNHSCAVLDSGELWCWGSNTFGELGIGDAPVTDVVDAGNVSTDAGSSTLSKSYIPVMVYYRSSAAASAIPFVVSQATSHYNHSCAILKSDGSLWCWGKNDFSQLGLGAGDTATRYAPILVINPKLRADALKNIRSVATGFQHTCVNASDDSLWCWGRNNLGQLGFDSGFNTVVLPRRVPGF